MSVLGYRRCYPTACDDRGAAILVLVAATRDHGVEALSKRFWRTYAGAPLSDRPLTSPREELNLVRAKRSSNESGGCASSINNDGLASLRRLRRRRQTSMAPIARISFVTRLIMCSSLMLSKKRGVDRSTLPPCEHPSLPISSVYSAPRPL